MSHTGLNELLQNWKAPDVPGDFDQNVWRRIRQREPKRAPAGWRSWILAPLRLAAAAALLAIAVGSWAGLRSARLPATAFPFAGNGTLTGSYLVMGSGGSR